jgi:hypothetical protein
MRHRTLKRCVLSSAFIFVVLARGHCRQAASWREFNRTVGFPESSFRSVTIADNGAILAVSSTSSRFCLFDGYEAKSFPLPKEAERVYQSPAGQLWTLTSQGLWTMKDQEWKLYPLPDLARAPAASQCSLCPVRLNVVLCLLPDRLVECSIEDPATPPVQTLHSVAETKIGRFSSMITGVEDELWVLGERGLARLSGPRRSLTASSDWREFIPPESLHLQHLRHLQPDEGGVTLVADSSVDGQSLLVRFDGEQWQAQSFGTVHFSFAWRGPDESSWASSSNQLFHSKGADLTVDTELSARQYYDVSVDWRGTFWLATSAGLVRFTPGLWRSGPAGGVTSLTLKSLANEGRWPELSGQISRFDADPARTAVIASSQSASQMKPIGVLRDGRVCCATFPKEDSNQRNRLAAFDGTNFQALPISVPQPASVSKLSCILAAQSGDVWLAGDFGTACLHGRWTVFPAAVSGAPEGCLPFRGAARGPNLVRFAGENLEF